MPQHPKVPVRETIPARFVDIIKHVARLIESGDESTTIESDDLLQDDEHDYCGGLTDPERQLFSFAFHPGPEDDNTEWTFELSKAQIDDIASGRLTQLDMWRCPSADCANRHADPDGYCGECDWR